MIEKELEQLTKMIRERAESYGSMESMCWDLGIPKSTVSDLMNFRTDFKLSTIRKIADRLDYDFRIVMVKKTHEK